jgi:glycosyltransferase involved in cell wall biosynthesis
LNKPLVSIVIPSFNRAYCLAETVESALAQTYDNIEIVLIDDGSTDVTRELAGQRWGNDPRIRYFYQENRGISAARNLGIANSRGNFIALLDSDDLWAPWKLEVQMACMERFPATVMVHTEMDSIGPDGRVLDTRLLRKTYSGYNQYAMSDMYEESCPLRDVIANVPSPLETVRVWYGDILPFMMTGNLAHASTILVRRDVAGHMDLFDEALRTDEIFYFNLQVSRRGPVAFVDASSLFYRRGNADHLWSPEIEKNQSPAFNLQQNIRYLHAIESCLGDSQERLCVRGNPPVRRAMADVHAAMTTMYLKIGRKADALRHLIASLRLRPWSPRLTVNILLGMLQPIRKVDARHLGGTGV